MPEFIYALSDLEIFWLLIGIITTISIILVITSKLFIFRKLRYKDNETIGSISSLIGIIYGVLIGFICLYLINNHDYASNATQREANASANVYLYSQWLKQPVQEIVQKDLKDYINLVIHQEWPLMENFKHVSPDGDLIIKKIFNDIWSFNPVNASETILMQNILNEIKELYNARHDRINVSNNTLSPGLWGVVLIGTILIIAINFAFRVNFYLHLFSLAVFSIMAASMLFLLVTLDRPFQGGFIVKHDAMETVFNLMNNGKPSHA